TFDIVVLLLPVTQNRANPSAVTRLVPAIEGCRPQPQSVGSVRRRLVKLNMKRMAWRFAPLTLLRFLATAEYTSPPPRNVTTGVPFVPLLFSTARQVLRFRVRARARVTPI